MTKEEYKPIKLKCAKGHTKVKKHFGTADKWCETCKMVHHVISLEFKGKR